MKADEFVKRLEELAPSIEEIVSRGFTRKYADEYRRSFFLHPKTTEISVFPNPLVELIYKYDTSNLEIGMITLGQNNAHFTPRPDRILVGSIEADPLVINLNNNAVEMLDHSCPDYVMTKCAVSGERFLKALLLLASFKPPYSEFKANGSLTKQQAVANDQAAYQKAVECAEVAGISGKPNIYEMLLGCGCWS